jgi:hypothetical protein
LGFFCGKFSSKRDTQQNVPGEWRKFSLLPLHFHVSETKFASKSLTTKKLQSTLRKIHAVIYILSVSWFIMATEPHPWPATLNSA